MNLISIVTLSVISLCHFGDSSVWSPSSHQVARRAELPYWLRTLRIDGGRLNSADGRLRKNRDAEDVFPGQEDDGPVVAERYIQQAQNGKVIASSGKGSSSNNNNNNNNNNMDDTMIFGDGGSSSSSSTDKVNGANSGVGIDFGVEDPMKNRSPQLQHGRPACNKSSTAAAAAAAATIGGDSDASQSEAAGPDVFSPSVDFIDQPDWAPLVNESQCQSYGPSQFCENVTNYPAEAISKILMSESGNVLKTFFADNTAVTQPFPSASESDESTMVLAQRKPGAPAVTAHAINTRTKPLESGNIQHLCESMTEFKFPKSAKNNQNEMLTIVNQDNISQPITVETCRNENQECKYSENFPAGYKSFCMQKYVTHHLAALKNGKIVREAFTFPSCCVCVLKLWDARTNSAAEARGIAMPSSYRRMASEVDVQQSQ